jgi:hypothetical protein
VYAPTPAGQRRVADWSAKVNWPHLPRWISTSSRAAAASSRLADPITLVDAQRRESLRQLRDVQRAAIAEPDRSAAGLPSEGTVLRPQADLRWLEACERTRTHRKDQS